MLNHIDIMGRLVRDPELRFTTKQDAVTSFTLAVDRDFGDETDFIDCVAWRKTAEFVDKHFSKGQQTCVSGSLNIREWTDRDGNKRRNAEVIVDNIYFCGKKAEYPEQTTPQAFAELSDDEDELPWEK